MKEVSTVILRLYFAVVAIVTLFTAMFGAAELLNMGLKTWVFPAADVPGYLMDCSDQNRFVYEDITEEEAYEKCLAANEQSIEQYHQEKASSAVYNLSLIIVTLPLFLLHFRIVLRDWRRLSGDGPKPKK